MRKMIKHYCGVQSSQGMNAIFFEKFRKNKLAILCILLVCGMISGCQKESVGFTSFISDSIIVPANAQSLNDNLPLSANDSSLPNTNVSEMMVSLASQGSVSEISYNQKHSEVKEHGDCPEIQGQEPLCDKQIRILSAIQQDPEPEVLYAVHTETIGRHYLVSDEKHPDLFKDSIENKGGTYIGVGFEQGYLYVGWQRSSLAFFIDYDPWVVLNHRVVFEVMKKCEDSKCLYNHFAKTDLAESFLDSQQAKEAGFSDKETRHRIKRLRYAVVQALLKLRESEYPTMMNNVEIYNMIRGLILNGRLLVLQANLLENGGILSIADAMKQLGAKVQTLYLSNAEQYWNYSSQFKTNMLSLPFAEDGIIMRTWATYPRNKDYRYGIQPASVFLKWMAHPNTRNVKNMTKHVSIRKPDQFPFVVDDILPE